MSTVSGGIRRLPLQQVLPFPLTDGFSSTQRHRQVPKSRYRQNGHGQYVNAFGLRLLVFKLDGYVRPHDGHVGHDDGVLHIDRHSSILESLDTRWCRYLCWNLHIPHRVGLCFSRVAGTAMPLHGDVEPINRQRLLEEHHGLGTRCGWSEERALED